MKQHSFVFEVTQQCNCECLHCYNVWELPRPYPRGVLGTAQTLSMLQRMLQQTGAELVTLTGGEPLLRPDLFEIVDFLSALGVKQNLITNGTLLDQDTIRRLGPDKISLFELPLLGPDRETHDRLSGRPGSFDQVTMAIASLKDLGQHVVAVFVAMKPNLAHWQETAELAVALGVDGMMFNRFNPGGRGLQHIDLLQAPPDALIAALDEAQRLSVELGLGITCSIAMPPCLFDHARWPDLGFGFCAAGTENAYYTLDPLGNLRPCNHSETILGNILESDFEELVASPRMRAFKAARPAFCADCKLEHECLGGCKAAAEVCSGCLDAMDPFLEAHCDRARKPT